MKRIIVSVFVAVFAAISLSNAAMAESLFKQGDLTGGLGWGTNEKSDSYLYGKGRAFFTDNLCGYLTQDIHHPANAALPQYKYSGIGLEYHRPFTSSFDVYASAGLASVEFRVPGAGGVLTEANGGGGLSYGIGAEYMFVPNWFLNIDLTTYNISNMNPALQPTTTLSATINWDFMNVMPLFKK